MRITPKYFLILAVMAGAAVVSASCASDGPSTAPVRQDPRIAQANLKDAHDKYDWIGKYHTDGLAYVYSQLEKGNGKPRTQKEMCKIVAKATKEFHKAQRHSDVPAGLVDPALNEEACPAGDDAKTKTVLATGVTRKTELSAGAVSLIDQIAYVINSSTSRSAFVNGVLSIESQAAYLSPDDAGAVIAVGSVALSSLDYWEANLDAWVSLSGPTATAYTLSPIKMTAAMIGSSTAPVTGPRYMTGPGSPWWQNPFVNGFGKVLMADAMAAARTIYATWYMGPIGWEAAGAAALFASATTAVILLM